jgi:hypothetical protein
MTPTASSSSSGGGTPAAAAPRAKKKKKTRRGLSALQQDDFSQVRPPSEASVPMIPEQASPTLASRATGPSTANLAPAPLLARASLGSNATDQLAGTTFVQGVKIMFEDARIVVFPFTDLSVKAEGEFYPRYRVFDILSKFATADATQPVLAQSLGLNFHVYGVKDFPGVRGYASQLLV